MTKLAFSGMAISGTFMSVNGASVIKVAGAGMKMCLALDGENSGTCFIPEEIIGECHALLMTNQGQYIQTTRAIRERFGIGLQKAKTICDLVMWKDVKNCKVIDFHIQSTSWAPLSQERSPRRMLVKFGGTVGVPTFVKLEVCVGNMGDTALMDELYSWAQNDDIPWLYWPSSYFRVMSCSDATCCSMTFGDSVTIYNEELPGTDRTYLCDHGGAWTRI